MCEQKYYPTDVAAKFAGQASGRKYVIAPRTREGFLLTIFSR